MPASDRKASLLRGGSFLLLVAVLTVIAVLVYPLINSRVSRPTDQGTAAGSISVGVPELPTALKPGNGQSQLLLDNVYQGLTSLNSANQPVAGLAELPGISQDGLTYTFHLRQDLRFSNGDSLTAEDVVWSLQQALGTPAGQTQLKGLRNVSNPNDSTVVIQLSAPKPDLLWILAGESGLVQDKAQLAGKSAAADSTLGSGPFTVSAFTPGKSLTLSRNQRYWGAAPGLAQVKLQAYGSAAAAVAALKAGQVQAITSLGQSSVTALNGQKTANGKTSLSAKAGMSLTSVVLRFNMNPGPQFTTSTLIGRQSIRRLLDNKALLQAAGGQGTVLGGPLTPLAPGYEDLTGLFPFDPAKGKAGFDYLHYSMFFTISFAVAPGVSQPVAQAISDMLKTAGVSANPQFLSQQDWQSKVEHDGQFAMGLTLSDGREGLNEYTKPDNPWMFDDPATTLALETANQATTPGAYIEALKKAARTASEYSGADWLFALHTTNAWDSNVTGFPTNLTDSRLPLAAVSLRTSTQ